MSSGGFFQPPGTAERTAVPDQRADGAQLARNWLDKAVHYCLMAHVVFPLKVTLQVFRHSLAVNAVLQLIPNQVLQA